MITKFLVLLISIFCFTYLNAAQTCNPPAIIANANSSNLFSSEQEKVLGELSYQSLSGEVRILNDEKLENFLKSLGKKIVKYLPPTGLNYQFHLVDIPNVNAFNIPGGHVFISRKLISFAKNEDELAGVIAHELGHATVHHGALDFSDYMRKILKITKLGDEKDVIEKYNLVLENFRTKRISQKRDHENAQQIEADKIGVFAMVAAGYDPNAFVTFFDRLAETEGKTGGWWSDVFGSANPSQKRLREMIQLTKELPQECKEGRLANSSAIFQQWQADIVSYRETNRKEMLPSLLWKKELNPKLRSDIWNFAFSVDGKLVLAQDDFSITIIDREKLQVLLQIPAENANEAIITPDGNFVAFITDDLHFEKWSISEKKALEVRELVVRRDCFENKLSPDGKYLVCIDKSIKINILETASGKKVFEKPEFYPLNGFEYSFWLDTGQNENQRAVNFFRIEFSPDAKNVVLSRSNRFRFVFKYDVQTVAQSENTVLALSLPDFREIKVGGDLKKMSSTTFQFVDSDKIVGLGGKKMEESGVFSFPSGKRISKFSLYAKSLKRTIESDYLIIKPIQNATMGVFDIKRGILATGFNKSDAAIWKNIMVFESASGKIQFRELSYNETDKKLNEKEIGSLDIPVGSIGNLQTAQVSDSLNWLMMSSKTRGGVWNLETGERKIFVRGYNSGVISQDGASIADFPKFFETPRNLVYMNSKDGSTSPIRELPSKGIKQYGQFLFVRKSLKEKKVGLNESNTDVDDQDEDEKDIGLKKEVKFELEDFIQKKTVWSREFPDEAPQSSFDSYSGRLILYYSLGSNTGKHKLKEFPKLKSKADQLGNKQEDYLVEVIDAFSQKTVGTILIETGNGSFDIFSGISERNYIMFYDSQDRVLIYSLKDGLLKQRFFGRFAAMNPSKDQIAIENFPGDISIYDVETGSRITNFIIGGEAVFIRFNLSGSRLFILSDNQNAYAFDLNVTDIKKK
jgi:beta-barrel assembly-enhancing protease